VLRSLFAGISGLRAHQTMMDVVANNIANVNTVGYKSSNAVFKDTLSQTLKGAGAPTAGANAVGGTNPAQIGLGVQLGAISTNFGQGAGQLSGRTLDQMIEGDGFFAVDTGTETVFTRAGSLSLDQDGSLVTPDGNLVQGWMGDPATGVLPGTLDGTTMGAVKIPIGTPADPAAASLLSYSISRDGTITGVFSDDTKRVIAQLSLALFTNPGGLEKVGGTMFRSTANSGTAQIGTAGTGGRGKLSGGVIEMSNVDLAAEFTNLIISQRGFQANSRIITASDQILEDLVNMKR
jgi:flagellar hook protein FlgE